MFLFILPKDFKVVTMGHEKREKGWEYYAWKWKHLLKCLSNMVTSFQFYCKLRFIDRFIVTGNKIVQFVPAAPVKGIELHCQAGLKTIWPV